MMWYHPPQVVVASALGYISIGCWLCAQLPYVPPSFTSSVSIGADQRRIGRY